MKRELLLAVAVTLLGCSSVMAAGQWCTPPAAEICYDKNNQAHPCTVSVCTWPDGRTQTIEKYTDQKQRPANVSGLTSAGTGSSKAATPGDLGGSPSKTPTNQTGLLPVTSGKALGSGPPQTSTKPLR